MKRAHFKWLLATLLWLVAGQVRAGTATSLGAEVFGRLSSSVVILRTTLAGSAKPNVSGSSFVVDRQGRAITNYHVVANYLFEPAKFELTYESADGTKGKARVLAIDVLNDLAVVSLDGRPERAWQSLELPERPMRLALGEAVFALGNPLDLGVTITQGSFSGVTRGGFDSRIHFTGPVNSGMSGGPAVDRAGRVIGINVAHYWGQDSVSFLVPVEHAERLYRSVKKDAALPYDELRGVINKQMVDRDRQLAALAFARPWRTETLGDFQVPLFLEEVSDCGSNSTDSVSIPPPVLREMIGCSPRATFYPKPDNEVGAVTYRHVVIRPRDPGNFNDFQLASTAMAMMRRQFNIGRTPDMGRPVCSEHFTQAGGKWKLPVRLVQCARAYRDFPDLYEVTTAVVSQNRSDAILVSHLRLDGVTWPTAMQFTARFLKGIQ